MSNSKVPFVHHYWRRANGSIIPVVMLLVLLLKITWGIWNWRDLNYGDTTDYYSAAMNYNHGEQISLVFSPLYVLYYSFFCHNFSDAFVATLLHRLVILVGFAVFLWLLFRAILPKALAWLAAAWWLILPVNWNALYEVHMFGALLLVIGAWLTTLRRRLLGLSLALACFWSSALLVRNEYGIAAGLLTLCCLAREVIPWRKGAQSRSQMLANLGRLAAPTVIMAGIACALFHHSWKGWSETREAFQRRQYVDVEAVYTYTYLQQHPDVHLDPWTEGRQLIKEKFGQTKISWREAFKHNPRAILQHAWWNLELLPAGLQLGLFDYHFGHYSPDFTPPRQNKWIAGILSALALSVVVWGIYLMSKSRRLHWRALRSRQAWGWLALFCVLPTSFIVIITQRPRPSYLFPFMILAIAVCAYCLYLVLRKIKAYGWVQLSFPIIILAVPAIASSEKDTSQLYSGQPLLNAYESIRPFEQGLRSKKVNFGCRQFALDLTMYLAPYSHRPKPILLGEIPTSVSGIDRHFQFLNLNLLYLDSYDLGNPLLQEWVDQALKADWMVLTDHRAQPPAWILMRKKKASDAVVPQPAKAN